MIILLYNRYGSPLSMWRQPVTQRLIPRLHVKPSWVQ